MAISVFFEYGSHLPSLICYVRVWTTQEEYFMVFIVVQNLVGINAVVFIICMFLILHVWHGNAYLRS